MSIPILIMSKNCHSSHFNFRISYTTGGVFFSLVVFPFFFSVALTATRSFWHGHGIGHIVMDGPTEGDSNFGNRLCVWLDIYIKQWTKTSYLSSHRPWPEKKRCGKKKMPWSRVLVSLVSPWVKHFVSVVIARPNSIIHKVLSTR